MDGCLGADGPTNPSASAYTVFYIEDSNTACPQAAIVFPPHGHIHVADEALELIVAARNFEFVGSDEDCRIEAGCDPWVEGAECLPVDCEISAPTGHAHVYTLSDYPACLSDEIDCNGDYVLSLRPSGDGFRSRKRRCPRSSLPRVPRPR